jgi:hypothetical protein
MNTAPANLNNIVRYMASIRQRLAEAVGPDLRHRIMALFNAEQLSEHSFRMTLSLDECREHLAGLAGAFLWVQTARVVGMRQQWGALMTEFDSASDKAAVVFQMVKFLFLRTKLLTVDAANAR